MRTIIRLIILLTSVFSYSQGIIPVFDKYGPFCLGDTISSLPTTSRNGITGKWTPELNFYFTTAYTFIPDGGQNAANREIIIEINPGTVPTFNPIAPICSGSTFSPLPQISNEGIEGTWFPEINNLETTTYTFTPALGQCAVQTTMTLIVNEQIIPSFPSLVSVCYGTQESVLPSTSINGISGQWTPAWNPYKTTRYTFTPDPSNCAAKINLIITVDALQVPTFDLIPPTCSSKAINVLPEVSNNGITGTWFPAFDPENSATYTFTPHEDQCATTATVSIEIVPAEVPIFDIISSVCSQAYLDPLPTVSTNGIVGTWSPDLDNTVTTVYTFTPNTDQCATSVIITIAVDYVVPEFDPYDVVCSGTNAPDFPSISKNGISGKWAPEFNSHQTTTYLFTPDKGQCASIFPLTIVVIDSSIDFTGITVCEDSEISELPTVSNNGIKGSWSKDMSENFIFVPLPSECNIDQYTIKPLPKIIPDFDIIGPITKGMPVEELPTMSKNLLSGTWSPALNNLATTTYTFTPFPGQCAESIILTIDVIEEVLGAENSTIDLLSQYQVPPIFLSSNEAGLLKGDLSVTNSGSASYNIPLNVPPGITGIEPKIGLNYNSQAGVGLAGVGWNIAGLSSISRIPSTIYHDGLVDPVDFDEYDRFAMDGQRLILKSGVYGAANSTYETEIFSNIKITYTGSYFKVDHPDGTTAYYGRTPDSNMQNIVYNISNFENQQNIRISYAYEKTNNKCYIKTIKYGSVASEVQINEIRFEYNNRQRAESSYINGLSVIDDKVLKEIRIKGNNVGYRNYILIHDLTMNYERVRAVIEKNGDNSKYLRPLLFEYEDSMYSKEISRLTKTNFIDGVTYDTNNYNFSWLNFSSKSVINGDFDGDGDQDCIYEMKMYTNISDAVRGNPEPIDFSGVINTSVSSIISRFALKILKESGDGYSILNRDAFCFEVKSSEINNPNQITYNIYAKQENYNNVALEYSRTVNVNPSRATCTFGGDFNGDGLTDRLIFNYQSNGQVAEGDLVFVNFDKRLTSGYYSTIGTLQSVERRRTGYPSGFDDVHMYTADMNGDGKTDIVVFRGGTINKITVYTVINNNLVILWETPFSFLKIDSSIFVELVPNSHPTIIVPAYRAESHNPIFMDVNGDGKCDIVLQGLERKVLISTGSTFVTEALHPSVPVGKELIFLPADFNQDGKSDIVSIYKSGNGFNLNIHSRISAGNWTVKTTSYNNYNPDCPNAVIDVMPFMIKSSRVYPDKPQLLMMEYFHNIPCLAEFKIGFYTNMDVLTSNKAVSKITYGDKYTETILYNQLIQGNGSYTYNRFPEKYPYHELTSAPSTKVVLRLGKQVNDNNNFIFKDYMYQGATIHLEGLGYLGFKGIRQTDWYDGYNVSKVFSTVNQFNPHLRGAVISTYYVEGLRGPIVQPGSQFYIRTWYDYNNEMTIEPLQANKVFKLRNTSTITTNRIDKTLTKVLSIYDNYNKIKLNTIVSDLDEQLGKNIEEIYTYDNPINSAPYMVGRPKTKSIKTSLFPNDDVSIIEEIYTYNRNLLLTTKRRTTNSGLTTDYITATLEYDSYGNVVTEKLSTPAMADRILSYVYDPTHRFKVSLKDKFGQITQRSYNLNTGVKLSETILSAAALPIKTNYIYDTWQKPIMETNYLGTAPTLINFTSYAFNDSNNVVATRSGNDGSSKKIYVDHFGRAIHEQVKDINDKWTCISTVYDTYGNIFKISKPYFINNGSVGNFIVWDEMEYDSFGRVVKASQAKSNTTNGKQITYTYNGLLTIENDGLRPKKTIRAPYGSVISLADNGEEINYTYFANGNIKTSTTGGATISIEQDGYGRRSKLIDPSVGFINYTYNKFNELLTEEIANKGTTNYIRDDFGRVISKTVNGIGTDQTNSKTDYYYSNNLLSQVILTDAESDFTMSYNYIYDSFNRLKSQIESRTGTVASKKYFTFQKDYMYDVHSKIEKERYYAKDLATNKIMDKWIKYTYKNGYKYQMYDMLNSMTVGSSMLWQLNNVDAYGNYLVWNMGNGTSTAVTNDIYGRPTNTMTTNANGSGLVSQFHYGFNNVTGNLTFRQFRTEGINWYEQLSYDSYDRLTSYKNVQGQQNQSYNSNGSIATNNIGEYSYTLSGKPYNNTSISLNSQPTVDYYSNHDQDVIYNTMNNPLAIVEENVERLNFEYNAFDARSVMYYGSTAPDKYNRPFRKFYSSDGSIEVLRKIVSGSTVNDFIFYIGGDAYSSPVIYKGNGTVSNYYYLHRDYQGSIAAITNQSGNVVERRLYDVWGSIIGYKSENSDTVPVSNSDLFIERGYTGHEHLLGVGLINMNGRIYDPKLHRFLQPDNNIQNPYNSQNYNRYGYCLNNPTKYSDPTGESWNLVLGFLFSTYVHGAQATGEANPTKWNAGDYFNAASVPASSYASFSITNFANDYIDNSQNKSLGMPPDDITVNSKGIVTKIRKNDKTDKFFDESGNQLFLNDFNFDSKWTKGIKVGDRLYSPVEKSFIGFIITKGGFIGEYNNLGSRYIKTAFSSHSSADFGFNHLRHTFNNYSTEYDGYKDGDGSLYRVEGQNVIYNFADLSQFIWGGWMRYNDFSRIEATFGAHLNNIITGGSLDSDADQRAIKNGFKYVDSIIKK